MKEKEEEEDDPRIMRERERERGGKRQSKKSVLSTRINDPEIIIKYHC